MPHQPFAPRRFLLVLLLLGLLLAFVHVGLLTIAFDRLGLSANAAFLLLFASLFGSAINIPVGTVDLAPDVEPVPPKTFGMLKPPKWLVPGKTLIAINVGGCVIPVVFCIYLFGAHDVNALKALAGVTAVAIMSRLMSQPIPGIGIGMPILVAPATAAIVALTLDPANSPALAYISGTLGVLIGADLLRFPDIRRLGAPFASIGGAGTFDGIFITGVVAVLLA